MATQRPYAGSSAERLTALINKDNNSEIREGVDFYFGVPEAYTDTEGRNTQIVLTPIPGRPFNPVQKTVFYKRLELAALSRLPEGMVKTVRIEAVPFSIHEILGALNAALGVDLQPDEVADDTLRDAPMESATKEELQRFVKLQEKLRLAIWAFQDTRSLRSYEELQNALDASRTFIEALHKRVHGESVRRLNG